MSQETPYASALSPEYALLGLLTQRPAHGYELYQRLLAELGQVWHISLSQIYNILNRLESKGWIAGDVQRQERLPARRCFQLTDAGRERFDAWLIAPTGSSVRAIRVEFITRLYFAAGARPHADRPIDRQPDRRCSSEPGTLAGSVGALASRGAVQPFGSRSASSAADVHSGLAGRVPEFLMTDNPEGSPRRHEEHKGLP